jgi:hypothetical protein
MSLEKNLPANEQPILVYPQQFQQEGEINLVEIVKVILKHKKVLFYSLLISLGVGLFFALSKVNFYEYTSTISIGSIDEQPIEVAQNAKIKLDNVFIPQVVAKFIKDNPEKGIKRIKSEVPKGGNLLILKSKAIYEDTVVSLLQKQAIKLLINDHYNQYSLFKTGIEQDLKNAKLDIELLSDKRWQSAQRKDFANQISYYQANIKNLENAIKFQEEEFDSLNQIERIKREQLTGITQRLKEFHQLQSAYLSKNNKETEALLSKAMIGIEIGDLVDKKVKIESFLLAEIVKKHKEIVNTKEDLLMQKQQELNEISKINSEVIKFELEQEEQIKKKQYVIDNLQIKLNNFLPTKQIMETQRSFEAIGSGRKIIVIISLIVGFLGGLLGIFVVEFAEKLKTDENS